MLPARFQAGTTFRQAAPEGATLYLRGPASITLESRDGFLTASAAATTEWTAGLYSWALRQVAADGTVSQRDSGTMDVLPDIANIPEGTDLRSQNRRTYDAICAVLEKRASLDQQKYRINNRELERTPISDLLKLRSIYAQLVKSESGRGGFRDWKAVI